MTRTEHLQEFANTTGESHAFGVGVGLGFAAVYSGRRELVGGAAAVAWAAVRSERPAPASGQDILTEIRREPQYLLGGLVAGAVLGAIARATKRDL